MQVAYFDCFSGASGDMIIAALLDAGLAIERLQAELAKLPLAGFSVAAGKVQQHHFAATRFEVQVAGQHEQPHRRLADVREVISRSALSATIKQRAEQIFTRLAEAEAAVHGSSPQQVHFHEVGAVDSIVDVVGSVAAIELLGIDKVLCSPIPTGHGVVKSEHGLMPVPAPATTMLLRGVPLAECDEPAELTTPTGAAILTSLAARYGPLPAIRIERIGVGAGKRQGQRRPNILRVLIGQPVDAASDQHDQVVVLEANLDDQPAQAIGYAFDRLFQAGALDVYATPILMKKNRPATKLSVIAPPHAVEAIQRTLFAETTTFGVRRWTCQRSKLQRWHEQVDTAYGPIRIKIGCRDGQVLTGSPEYDDCSAAARRHGTPLHAVMAAAMQAWQRSRSER